MVVYNSLSHTYSQDSTTHVVEFLNQTLLDEIESSDSNTLLRGNSLGTKCVDEWMKVKGLNYLHLVLCPVISEVSNSKKSFELDPSRLEDTDKTDKQIVENGKNLSTTMSWVLRRIFESI
eukprot:Pgem_evm1s7683